MMKIELSMYDNIEMLLMDWLYDWFNMYGKTESVPN